MKILHTADWHIGAYVGPQCDDPTLRMSSTMNCLNYMVSKAKTVKPDVILVAGDLIHVAKTWSDRALVETEAAAGILNQLAAIAPTVVLYGTPNHDNAAGFSLMTRMCPKVHFITEPRIITLDTVVWKVQIAGVPGIDRGIFRAQMPGLSAEDETRAITAATADIIRGLSAQLVPEMPSILMAHHTVIGATLDNGQEVFEAAEPVIESGTIDSTGFDLVALGHIHRQQAVMSCRKPTYYCGSINANSFGEEDNQPGFLVHEIYDDDGCKPGEHWLGVQPFFTPARKFKTFRNSISDFAFDGIHLDGEIVRVLYTGTDEQERAMDRREIERTLYSAHASYVAEIRPESIVATVNRERLHETLEPEDCLRRYLTGQKTPAHEADAIVDIARPIIAAALANAPAGGQSGVFLPLSLEVSNYRSYSSEKLDFESISFAMVNGRNGVGKSSLFMDALLDCLYEQPREGELTGWIRAGERSGSIMFTFQLGKSIWRVTRTRARSGKATLAIAELEDLGPAAKYNPDFPLNWTDHSAQRMADTQQAIINLLGMDSETFRSCVLIMQDAYGSFMEAKPDDRMAVLANLLGLGIYEAMEDATRAKLQEVNRTLRADKVAADINAQEKQTLEPLVDKLAAEKRRAADLSIAISEKQAQRDELAARSADVLAIKTDIRTTQNAVTKWEHELNDVNARIEVLERNLASTRTFLADEPKYTAAQNEYQRLRSIMDGLQGHLDRLDDMKARKARLNDQISSAEIDAQVEAARIEREAAAIAALEKAKEARAELGDVEAARKTFEDNRAKWQELNHEMTALSRDLQTQEASCQAAIQAATRDLDDASKQHDMLQTANCIDISRAQCKFLAEAKLIASTLTDRQDALQRAKDALSACRAQYDVWLFNLTANIDALHFEPLQEQAIRRDCDTARAIDMHLAQGEATHQRYQTAMEQKIRAEQTAAKARLELADLSIAITELQAQCSDVDSLVTQMGNAAPYASKYNELPAARRYLEETEPELIAAQARKAEAQQLHEAAMAELCRLSDLEKSLGDSALQMIAIDAGIRTLMVDLSAVNREIGSLEAQTSKLPELVAESTRLNDAIQSGAQLSARLDMLVAAFGQDGIPHQIIRDIVPDLEAQANEILSTMTGGRMRLQYRTEKVLKSNKNKEVATLDIVITDVDSGDLPYLSRSGGQKVRAALAQAFALAMIKASRVGMQLGMMFVDEPPFLDDEGSEAYCAALASIHNSYPEMRIVAISHDPTMKAQFPQQIDVVMTESGSRIRIA